MSDLKKAYETKLASSGLTPADGKKLAFTIITDPQKEEDHFCSVAAFKIPYTDRNGKTTGFYRIRYLAGTKKGFAKATTAKERRYDQPASELPQLYAPNLLPKGKGWAKIFADPAIPIVFTEGELKAACATKHGVPTLALGGVWNFKSKKNGLRRLPFFEDINWKGRTIFIIFDSDAATNPQVMQAQYKFAEETFALGAVPLVVSLPQEGDKKVGIDDYIVANGAVAFKDMLQDEANHKPFAFVKELLKLNSELAVVHKPVAVIHFPTRQLLDKNSAAMLYANCRMIEPKMVAPKKPGEKEGIKYEETGTFDRWLKWEGRGEVFAPVYEPGKEPFVWLDDKRYFNTWKGWGAKPAKGDVSLWTWLLDNVFKNATPAERRWFEQWCAYPIQNPGVKMYTCPILFGQLKGTGKSLIGLSLKEIYGENGAEITDTQLEDERNVFAAEKQFVLANEVTGSDKRTMVGRLRNLITQHSVVINKKYQPDYVVRDTINYFFTSNHVDAVYMEDDERRFFVHEVLGPRLVDVDKKKVEAYDAWFKSGGCASALFHHLLSFDLTGFDPTAPAPDTESKDAMVSASRTELESWAFKLKEDPDTCLRTGNTIIPFSLFKVKDLIDIFAGGDLKKPYEKTMANSLRKAGFLKAAHGSSCPTKDGQINLWAIRDDHDHKLSRKDIGERYDAERDFTKPKKFAKGAKKP